MRSSEACGPALGQEAASRRHWVAYWARALYVPIATLVLLVFVGGRLTQQALIGHKTTTELRFGQQDPATLAKAGLNSAEGALALAVHDDRAVATSGLQVLFLGNSEPIAIVNPKAGDLDTVQWFQVYLARKNAPLSEIRVHSRALPGMGIAEMLITAIAAGEQRPSPANVMVVGLSPEVFRKVGDIRSDIAQLARSEQVQKPLQKLLAQSPELADARAVLEPITSGAEAQHSAATQDASAQPPSSSWLDRLESRLEDYAGGWRFYRERQREQIYMAVRFIQSRNHLFRIKTSDARPMSRQAYQTNLQLLKLLVRYANDSGMHVILYLMPLRGGTPNPYPPEVREQVRSDVEQICRRHQLILLDYTNEVADDLYDNNPGSGGTFVHFTEAGHQQVGKQLMIDLEPLLRRWAQRESTARL